MAGLFESLLGGGTAAAGIANQMSTLSDLGDFAVDSTTELANTAKADTQFRPFSVTSTLGNIGTDEAGSITANLNGPDQLRAIEMRNNAMGMFANASADQTGREQSIFDQLMATTAPQEERERLALESRLFSQGRGGMRSDMFGGSPEQLAMAIAGANLGSQLNLGGIQSKVNAEKLKTELMGGLFNQGSKIAGAAGGAFDDPDTRAFISDFLQELF
mgnify:CR=1 FL=1